jgi:hypothetical protein
MKVHESNMSYVEIAKNKMTTTLFYHKKSVFAN